MSEIDSQPFPRAALYAAAALVGTTLALTGAVSAGLIPKPKNAAVLRDETKMAALSQRTLAFADLPGGALEIRDVGSDSVARTIRPGEKSGFIRGVLRSFARERMLRELGPEAAFRLTLWANQSLSITDLATGRTVELDAFGPDNRAAFAALLPHQRPVQGTVAAK